MIKRKIESYKNGKVIMDQNTARDIAMAMEGFRKGFLACAGANIPGRREALAQYIASEYLKDDSKEFAAIDYDQFLSAVELKVEELAR